MKTLMSKMQKKLTGQRFDMLPVDEIVEPGLEVLRPRIIDVIAVLPDIDAKDRLRSVHQRVLAVGSLLNFEFAVLDGEDTRFYLSLLPVPYLGNLKSADIFILLLNPRFGLHEFEDDADPIYRGCLEQNLSQQLKRAEFPFCMLNPRLVEREASDGERQNSQHRPNNFGRTKAQLF